MLKPEIVIEEVSDPIELQRSRAQHERHVRNSDWLAAHWHELLPHARGRFVAVADQQAFVADSAREAWEWARTSHPGDDGAIVQYVRKSTEPRIYDLRRVLENA
jgi:hypothetical protein